MGSRPGCYCEQCHTAYWPIVQAPCPLLLLLPVGPSSMVVLCNLSPFLLQLVSPYSDNSSIKAARAYTYLACRSTKCVRLISNGYSQGIQSGYVWCHAQRCFSRYWCLSSRCHIIDIVAVGLILTICLHAPAYFVFETERSLCGNHFPSTAQSLLHPWTQNELQEGKREGGLEDKGPFFST